MLTREKIYKIDDRPVSPHELIEFAAKVDIPFSLMKVKRTSLAAAVIRAQGYKVTTNRQEK